jgi:hypothetical protein
MNSLSDAVYALEKVNYMNEESSRLKLFMNLLKKFNGNRELKTHVR